MIYIEKSLINIKLIKEKVMYLVIRKDNKDFYYSECFGILKQNTNEKFVKEKFIVFNSDYTNLILTDKNFYYRVTPESKSAYSTRKLFLLDNDKSKWVSANEDLQGYDFIVNNDAIMKKLLNNEQLDSSIVSQAKEINEKFVVTEWRNVVTENDIKNFEQVANNFYDAYVEKMIDDNESTVFVFDTTWDYLVYVKCDKSSLQHNIKVEEKIMWFWGNVDKIDNGFKFTFFEESSEGKRYGFIETKSIQWKIELLPLPDKTWVYIENSKDLN